MRIHLRVFQPIKKLSLLIFIINKKVPELKCQKAHDFLKSIHFIVEILITSLTFSRVICNSNLYEL